MPAGKFKLYHSAKEFLGDGTIDLDSHEFKVALFTSASNANTLSLEQFSELTNEIAAVNGYTAGGQVLTNVTWNRVSGTVFFDFDDPVWTADSGPLTARFAVVYNNTNVDKQLLCVILLDTAPADVSVADGQAFRIILHPSGAFSVSGASTD
jgi:hypothetical protein